MANYLIIQNDKVVNVIVADTKEIAEEVTGLEAVESFGSEPWIGWTRLENDWIKPIIVEEISDTILGINNV